MTEPGTDIAKWADQAMFEAVPMAVKRPDVNLLWATPDPLGAVAAGARMYEGHPTYSLQDITNDERKHYFEQVAKSHLQAPFEFVKFHFFIEAVTRSFTHQMVRQRTAVYAQESLRFAVKEGFASEAVKPPAYMTADDVEKGAFDACLETIEATYNFLIDKGWPAEDARELLPHCCATRINYVTDLANLLGHAGNRLCTQAQFIWREVFIQIVTAIHDYNPPVQMPERYQTHFPKMELDPDSMTDGPEMVMVDLLRKGETHWQFQYIANSNLFKPVCFRLGHCPFQAVYDRQCTIRARVNRGEFNKIRPEEYMADPTAGRRDDPTA